MGIIDCSRVSGQGLFPSNSGSKLNAVREGGFGVLEEFCVVSLKFY